MAKPKKTEYTIDECYLMMFSEYEDVVTAQEAAGMLRLPLKRVYRMFRAGEIKSLKVGKDVRTCKLWIIEYIQKYGFIRQEKFHHERQAAVTVFCQTPKSRNRGSEFGADADFLPYYAPGIIALDACTAFNGKVNVVVLEDEPMHGK